MSALMKSIVVLVILAAATMAVFAVFGLVPWSQMAEHIGRIALVGAIVAAASLAIAWLLRRPPG